MPPAFWIWAAWRDKGGIPAKRPANLPDRIPASWWVRYLIHKGIKIIPKPPRNLGPAQYVWFAAQEPEQGLRFPTKCAIAISADMAYRYDNLREIIDALRFKGHRVPGWCDCRPDGTLATTGALFVKSFQLDYFIGQAETADQFDAGYAWGARVMVGNMSELRSDQMEKCSTEVLFIQEDYWNEGWARYPKSDAIAAYCIGIYATALWDPNISSYKAAGRFEPGDGGYHVAACTDPENA